MSEPKVLWSCTWPPFGRIDAVDNGEGSAVFQSESTPPGIVYGPSALRILVDERAALEAEAAELRATVQLLRGREVYFAGVLGVADGGQYSSDWDAPIRRVVAERDELRKELDAVSRELRKLWPGLPFDRRPEYGRLAAMVRQAPEPAEAPQETCRYADCSHEPAEAGGEEGAC